VGERYMSTTTKSITLQLREAAWATPDKDASTAMLRIADEIEECVQELARYLTDEQMIRLNGLWVLGARYLMFTTPEGGGEEGLAA
jgi:hypothetical protein